MDSAIATTKARNLSHFRNGELLAHVSLFYDRGLQELAHLLSPESLQELRARTAALEGYVLRALSDREGYVQAHNQLAELRIRAERSLGAWLRDNVNHGGGGDRRRRYPEGTVIPGDLPEGISKKQSSCWQKLADLSETAFEGLLVKARDAKLELSTAGVLRLAKRFHYGPAESPVMPAVHDYCTVADLEVLRAQGRRFGTIYADPPWRFENTASRGAAANHYPTMSLDEIKALPIRDLAAEGAHCHCWVPNAFLFQAPEVLEAWGFEQKSLLIWIKPHMGCGNYFRLAHEFLATGLRPGGAFRDHSQRSWQYIKRTRHSEKPEQIRQIIMKVSPPPYLELFARRLTPGWTVFGDQIERPGLFDSSVDLSAADAPEEIS